MLSDEIMIEWYKGHKVAGAKYVLDMAVLIQEGEFSGSKGSVISLESLEPKVTYLVETSEGRARVIEEEYLAPIT